MKSTRDGLASQNRKKSMLKDDHTSSRLKEDRRGYSANPKNIISKQSKPGFKNAQMIQSIQLTDVSVPPKQHKILAQFKHPPRAEFSREYS